MRDDEYLAIKERAAAFLKKNPDVTAVGLGGRERSGQPTGEIVIKVFVKRKKPAAEVPPHDMIPESFEGVPTDVVEMEVPIPRLDPVPGAYDPEHYEMDNNVSLPYEGGTIIGVRGIGNGTLGCFLRDKGDGTAVYGLTNYHVLGKGKVSQSELMHPPGGYVAVGTMDKTMDAAVIRLEAGPKWAPKIKEIGFVTGSHKVTLGESLTQTYQVRKRGARTGLTGGVVISIATESWARKFDIIIRPNKPPPPHQDEKAYFALPGDSGSAVVNDDNEVIGLLWGGTSLDVATPLDAVTPIDFILDAFRTKKASRLDLEVATGTGPTDESFVLQPAGAPGLSLADMLARRDRDFLRPLVGGSQIIAEPFGSANSATLGCFVRELGDGGKAYILTSYAGLSAGGQIPPTTDTGVRQPDKTDTCSGCCSHTNTVGMFSGAAPEVGIPTVALVALKDDQKWLAEVMGIGYLEGIASFTPVEVNSGFYQVRKRGTGSRLTGGTVRAINFVAGQLLDGAPLAADRLVGDVPAGVQLDAGAMLIRPNPNPRKPGQDIYFSYPIDRGAVLVNAQKKVVGLLYGEVEVLENGVKVVHGVAMQIQVVLDALNKLPGVNVELATATAGGQVHTTNNRVAVDLERSAPPVNAVRPSRRDPLPHFDVEAPELVRALGRLQTELSYSSAGRLALALWADHRDEIRHLIDHNRRVATVWHRSGGPALLQAFVRALQLPSATIPSSVNGVPTARCLDRLATTFCRYGSPALQAALMHVHALLPPIGGLSLSEILAALRVAPSAAEYSH